MSLRGTVLAVLVGAVVMGGCSHGGDKASAKVPQRPLIKESAVEAASRQDGSALAFYDALESLPLASQDDAVNASLLLGTGQSAPSYDQRVAAAKTLGYLPGDYSRPARQAVTVGEVSSMFIGILEGKLHDPDDALMRMQRRNAVTLNVQSYNGLTGAQLASVIGATRDAMGIEGVQKVAFPTPAAPPVVVAQTPPPAPTPAPPAHAAEPSDADKMITSGAALSDPGSSSAAPAPSATTAGRPEPLPNLPPGESSKPVVIGPSGQPTGQSEPAKPVAPKADPTPPSASTPAPPPAPVKPPEPKTETPKKEDPKPAASPWVTGTPLKKG